MGLTNGLVAYYKLDEASGDAIDATGNFDPLVQASGTIGSTTGKINTARDFEAGDTEYFIDGDDVIGLFDNESFTVACWILAESIGATTPHVCGTRNGNTGWQLSKATTHEMQFGLGYNTGSATISTDSTISASTWYFVAGVHDAENDKIQIYISGTLKSLNHSLGVVPAPPPAFRIGRSASPNYWDGLIDELAIWDRALSESELDQLYNGGSGLAYPLGDVTGAGSLVFSNFTTSAAGFTLPKHTGTSVVTFSEFTTTATGTFRQKHTATSAFTFSEFATTATGFTLPKIIGAGTLVLGNLETTATGTFTPLPGGTHVGTAAVTFGNLETTAAGITGLHYPNSATTYDVANIDPFYSSFNRYNWTNANDGRFDDSTYASVTLTPAQGGFTYVLEVSNFGFAVPDHSRIDGFKVEIKRRKTGTAVDTDWSIFDAVVQLCKTSGSVVGTNRAVGTEYPEAHAYATYGNATDLWGASWTAAEVNATTFGVALACTFTNNSADFDGTVEVDATRATVFFTPPHAGVATLAFGNLETTATGFTVPKYTGTATLAFGNLETTAVADSTVPVYTATAARTFGNFETTATGAFSNAPVYLAAGAVTFGNLETTSTGVTHRLHLVSGQFTFRGFITTATGTVLPPVYAGTAAQTFKRIQTTAVADSTVPTYSGQAAVTYPAFDLSGVGNTAPPAISIGTATLTMPDLDTSAAALFIPQQFVAGTAALSLPSLTLTGSALQIDPVWTAAGAYEFSGITTMARSTPIRGINFHAGILSGPLTQNGTPIMSLGAVIETDYTFIEGYREIAKIEFVERLGADIFTGTPAVTEIGKHSVTVTNPRINDSLENIDGVVASPGQAILFDVSVTAAKKQPTVLRVDCDSNNPLRSIVVDFVFHTRR